MSINALYKLSYGVYMVTSKKDTRMNGQIANTVFQVTSEPPTVAASINKNNLAHESVKQSRAFSASVLCQDTPLTLIGRFGFRSGEVVNADVISDEVCMTYDYYHQVKGGKTPKAAATYLDEKKVGQVPKEEKPKWRNTNAPSAAIYITQKRATPMAV